MSAAYTEGASGRGNAENTGERKYGGAQPGRAGQMGSRVWAEGFALKRHRDKDFRDWRASSGGKRE